MTSRAAAIPTTPSNWPWTSITRSAPDFPKVPFVFLSMKHAPNSAFADAGRAQSHTDRYNDLAKAQAKKDASFKYFDMDAPVLDATGKVQPTLFLDGEHFNDKGYALINPKMQQLLVSLHVPHSNSGNVALR